MGNNRKGSRHKIAKAQNRASKKERKKAEEFFKTGLVNHQSGRLEEAEILYNQALKSDSFHFDALHMFGVLACQRGEYNVGIDAIRKALSINPHVPACHSNLGKALEDLGSIEEAIVCYEKAISLKSDSAEAYGNLGNALTKLGKLEQAALHCRRAIELRPDYVEAYHNLGNALFGMGRLEDSIPCYQKATELRTDYWEAHYHFARVLHNLGNSEKALNHYKKTIALRPDYAEAHNSLGILLKDLGRAEEALICYWKAIELNPSFADVHNNMGNAHWELKRIEEAIRCYEKAIALKPDFVEPHFNIGLILMEYGKTEESKGFFQRVIQIKPDYPEAMAYLSYVLEKMNELDKAKEVSNRALQYYELSPVANLVAAKCERRQKNFKEAISKLERTDFESANPSVQTEILFEKGRVYDRMVLQEQAFEALSSANKLESQKYPLLGINPKTYIEKVKDLESFFRNSSREHWRKHLSSNDNSDPVFLVGFPRSGTTLLDQILDARQKVAVIEEKPLVWAMLEWFPEKGMKYPEDLELGDEKMREDLRRIYLTKLSEFVDSPNGNILVDKLPLNIVDLGLIHWVFPGAKIILALRHPCDVVLSCFMQGFSPNEAMSCFSDLGNTARLYDAVMSLWHTYLDVFMLDVHVIRYEDLISDFDRETKNLFEFLKIPWDASVRDYSSHAKSRGPVFTPSYHQVAEPIYHHAKYRWKHYVKYLEPVLPLLEPHVRRFGYPSTARI